MAIHSRQNAIGNMLDRNVHIFKKAVVVAKLGYKLVCDLIGIAIKKSYPRNGSVFCDLAHKIGEGVSAVKVKAVSCGILSDKVYFLDAHSLKILCLGNDILDGSRAESAADKRNCAVGATVVTALRDLQVSGVRLGGYNSVAAKLALLLITEGGVSFASHNRLAGIGDIAETSNANKGFYLGHLFHHLVAITLNKAACCYDMFTFSVLFQRFRIKNTFNRFLLCALNKAAGVNNYDLRLLFIRGDFKAPCVKIMEHYLGVHKILGAAERYKSNLCHLSFSFFIYLRRLGANFTAKQLHFCVAHYASLRSSIAA